MASISSVAQYLDKHPEGKETLSQLAELAESLGLTPSIKWNAPVYTFEGKNILGLGAFKAHVAVWFFNGVAMTEYSQYLHNAQAGKTHGMRQWRLSLTEPVDLALAQRLFLAAIDVRDIKTEKPASAPKINLESALLMDTLAHDDALKSAFAQLAPYKQKEYHQHISGAKREATQAKRLAASLPLIAKGMGLNDKYRK